MRSGKAEHRGHRYGYPVALLAAFLQSPPSSAVEARLPTEDSAAARVFDYCHWAHTGQEDREKVPDIETIIGDATADEETLASAVLVDAGTRMALASKSRKSCEREFSKGLSLFGKTLARQSRQFRAAKNRTLSADPAIAAIQSAITRHWVDDQAARLTYVALQTTRTGGREYWAYRLSVAHATLVDAAATRYMKTVLESFDWIDSGRFGSAVSRQAWTLVQHADDHPEFQERVLRHMETYLDTGGVSPRDYAYLWDRVAVNKQRLQRYGTQPIWKCQDGKLRLHPMEDPANVDERRAEMGMGSVESGLAEMARNTCR